MRKNFLRLSLFFCVQLYSSGLLLENLTIKYVYSSFVKKNFNWIKNKPYTFDEENFNLLLQNKIAAIKIGNFVSKEQASILSKNMLKIGFNPYENVYPPIGRIGITQFEHAKQGKENYFKQVSNALKLRDQVFNESGIDVIMKLKNFLSKISYKADIAHEGNMSYFAGLMRNITGTADLHFDYAPYDAPEWSIGKLTNQIAWNVYTEVPEKGGETIVYNKIWQPEIYNKFLSSHNTGSYGFEKELVNGVVSIRIKPSIGDLWLFNSQNFHEVLSSEGRTRLSISSFIGQVENNKNVFLWS